MMGPNKRDKSANSSLHILKINGNMEHWELVQEMPHVEQLPTQERLQLARRRRQQQLKVFQQKEKEWHRKPSKAKSNKRNIYFNESVVLLEAAARNDVDEASMGGFAIGAILDWLGPEYVETARNHKNQFKVPEILWLQYMTYLGAAVSNLSLMFILRIAGCRLIMVYSSIALFLAVFIQVVRIYYVLLFARFLLGVCVGYYLLCGPLFIAEIAEAKIRGFLISMFQMLVLAGSLFINLIGFSECRIGFTVPCCIPPIIVGAMFLSIKESPITLIRFGKETKARESLRYYRGKDYNISDEFSQMKQYVAMSTVTAEKSLKTLIWSLGIRKGLFFTVAALLLQQTTCILVVLFIIRRLLMRGVSPDSSNEDGLTALHQCCIDDNEPMLQLLLEYGANVNAEDSEKWTPLHAAATCGHLRLVRALISRGANLLAVNADGNMPYDICEDEAALDYIELEMAKRGVTQQLIDETRAHTEMQMLVDLQEIATAGGDMDAYDSQGATPLHIASANGYISVVEFLLDHHVNTDSRDRDDWQPAHAAACWGHLEVLELLVHAGADLNAKNKHEETPADICEDSELRERIIQLQTEQESKKLADQQRKKVRRTQSNTRAQSVRRTSLRDKGLTTKKDAMEETKLRIKAQEGYENPDALQPQSTTQNGNVANHNSNNRGIPLPTSQISTSANSTAPTSPTINNPYNGTTTASNNNNQQLALIEDKRSAPEGKDNDSLVVTEMMHSPQAGSGDETASVCTTDVNGKVTVVHVVVTINGTLADLKKQRAQIRNSSGEVNSLNSPVSSIPDNDSLLQQQMAPGQTGTIPRFTGNTSEVVDYSKSRRCCIIQ